MYQISVVIPVYNGEKYLRECVDSILAQSINESFEIVLIDDGSTDSSGGICDHYASIHNNIHVYHKPNEGINQTRKFGVKVAKGEWIAFSDQDDSMPIDALQQMWDKCEGTDLVIGFPETPSHRKDLDLNECRENAIFPCFFPPTPWAKLYRKSLLTDDVFDFPRDIDGSEDMIMNIRIMFHLQRAPHFVFKKVYNFRRNTASVSHTRRTSLKRLELFDRVRKESIPADELTKYMPQIIRSRLNGLVSCACSDPKQLCNKQNKFLLQLNKDIIYYRYKMNFQERLLLKNRWVWSYKFISLMTRTKNSLRYRLGLNN